MKHILFLVTMVFPITILLHVQQINEKPKEKTATIKTGPIKGQVSPQDDSSSMAFELISENSFYLVNKGEPELYVMAKVTGPEDLAQKKRTPLNISLVMDRSGSMSSENKLENVKKACKLVINNLSDNDLLSIVAYDDQVNVVQSSSFVKNKAILEQKVTKIQTGGSTNLSGGMLEGFAQVLKTYKKQSVNRVLLLSDGLANEGITDKNKLQEIVQKKYSGDNIAISTFGVGSDFNEDMMTNLAEYGRGNYHFINSPDEIPGIFKDELDGLLSVVAQNTVLELVFQKEFLELEKVYGYEYKVSENKLVIDYNDVFAKEEKVVLIKFRVRKAPTSSLEFNATLKYDDVLTDYKRVTQNKDLKIEPISDKEKYDNSFNTQVLRNIIMFTAIDNFELAAKRIDEGKYEEARKIMKTNIDYMQNNKRVDIKSDSLLFEQFNTYQNYSKEIKNYERMKINDQQMLQKSNKSMNYKLKKKKRKKK